MRTDEKAVNAYAAALQAAASNGARGLMVMEGDDPEVRSLRIEVDADFAVVVTLIGASGHEIGGYTL